MAWKDEFDIPPDNHRVLPMRQLIEQMGELTRVSPAIIVAALNHVTPRLGEQLKIEDVLTQVETLLQGPLTPRTRPILEIRAVLRERQRTDEEKLSHVLEIVTRALREIDKTPKFLRIFGFGPNDDFETLYRALYRTCAGEDWNASGKSTAEQPSDPNDGSYHPYHLQPTARPNLPNDGLSP